MSVLPVYSMILILKRVKSQHRNLKMKVMAPIKVLKLKLKRLRWRELKVMKDGEKLR